MESLPSVPGSCPYGVDVEDVDRMTPMFAGSAGGCQGAPGDDGPQSGEFLRGDHLTSTITSLGEIVSLPRWPTTRISLGCT